jgi:hypothetical protein
VTWRSPPPLPSLVVQQETANPSQIIECFSDTKGDWNGCKKAEDFRDTKQYDGDSNRLVFIRQSYSYLHILKVQGNTTSLIRVI